MEELHRALAARVGATAGARAALHELKNGRSLHSIGPCYSLVGLRRLLGLATEKSPEQRPVLCAAGLLSGEIVLSARVAEPRALERPPKRPTERARKRGRERPEEPEAGSKRARGWLGALPGLGWLERAPAVPAPAAEPACDARAEALEAEARAAFARLRPEQAPSEAALVALGTLARAMLGARAAGAPDVDLFERVGVEFNAADAAPSAPGPTAPRSDPQLLSALERAGAESRAARVLLVAQLTEGASLGLAQLELWLTRAGLSEPAGALYREPAAGPEGRARALLLVCFG